MTEFRMPTLGADMQFGTIVDWRVKPGDAVKRGDVVALVETEKGVIEVEIFEDGVIASIQVQPGKKVPVGTPLATLRANGATVEAPQVALVGFGKISESPWAANGMLGVKRIIVATLSADHRVSDGHRGGRFLIAIDRLLQEPGKL